MFNLIKIRKMAYTHILGIDISKKTFDVALTKNKAQTSKETKCFTNTKKGYQQLSAWLKKEQVDMEKVLICMENTGIYHRALVTFLQGKNAMVWVENPCQIKWSMGLQRGKSDVVDAQRIVSYAYRNQDKAQAYQAKDQ